MNPKQHVSKRRLENVLKRLLNFYLWDIDIFLLI